MASWVMWNRGEYCSLQTLELGDLPPAEGTPEFLSCSVAGGVLWPAAFCLGPKGALSEFKLNFSCLIQPCLWASCTWGVLESWRHGNTSRPRWCLEWNIPFLCVGLPISAPSLGCCPAGILHAGTTSPCRSSWGQAVSKPCLQALQGEQLAFCFPAGCSVTCLTLLVHAAAWAPGMGRASGRDPLCCSRTWRWSSWHLCLVQTSACMCFARLGSPCPFFVSHLPHKIPKSWIFWSPVVCVQASCIQNIWWQSTCRALPLNISAVCHAILTLLGGHLGDKVQTRSSFSSCTQWRLLFLVLKPFTGCPILGLAFCQASLVWGHVWIIFVSMATLKTFEVENSQEGSSCKILVSYSFYENDCWVVGLYLIHVSSWAVADTQPVFNTKEPTTYSHAQSRERATWKKNPLKIKLC